MMAYAAPLVSEESLRDTTGIDGRWTGPNYWDPLREGGKSPRTYHYEQATIELEKAMVLSIKFCSGDAAFPAKTNWRGQRMPNSLQVGKPAHRMPVIRLTSLRKSSLLHSSSRLTSSVLSSRTNSPSCPISGDSQAPLHVSASL